MKREAKEIEVEVLPKEDRKHVAGPGFDDPFVELVARLMDSIYQIPGTKVRLGLDPLIGLIPGIGSPLSAFVSLFLIARSARHRVPKIVLARMAMNVAINSLLDGVPVVGDTLSIFFRSNAMNYELLRKHANTAKPSTKRDWLFVFGLIGGLGLILLLAWIGFFVVIWKLYHSVSGALHW